jgi:hypothetical protein
MKIRASRSSFAIVALLVVSGYGGTHVESAIAQSASAQSQASQTQTPQAVQTKPSVQGSYSPPQPHTDAPPEPVKRYPGDGDGAYKTGAYRDLFSERRHSATESRAKIDAAFSQLFHGDKDSQAIYYEAGSNANGPLAYVTDIANHDARTEGMSYGMMIAVQLDKKRDLELGQHIHARHRSTESFLRIFCVVDECGRHSALRLSGARR